MKARADLPDLELACIRLLWEKGDMTVRDVQESLKPHRPLAYTTVMTVLDRLARKKAVSRIKRGKAHLYHAEYPREAALDRALHRLIENYFDGSRDRLRSYLAGSPSRSAAPAVPGAARAAAQEALDDTLL